jgi:hypothetical protein
MDRKSFVLMLLCAAGFGSHAQRAEALLPDYYAFQFAGSIGTGSVGVGYNLFKEKTRLSLHYGFVPVAAGGELNIVALKWLYRPWHIASTPRLSWNLFDVGAMMSYHFGEAFHTRWPSHRYPRGYYWWRPSLRYHLVIENSVTWQLERGMFDAVSGYVEANSNELYLVSYALNTEALSPFQIFKLGLGVRLRIRK